MRFNLTIAAKLAINYGLFLLPIVYLGYQMVADKQTNIGFARTEIQRGMESLAYCLGVLFEQPFL